MALDNESYFEQELITGCFRGFMDMIIKDEGSIRPLCPYVYKDNKGMHLELESFGLQGPIKFYARIPAEHPIMPAFSEKPIIADITLFHCSLN